MLHARPDWNGRIVDLDGRIPADEPVLLIRSQDAAAPATARAWAARNDYLGGSKLVSMMVLGQAELIEAWQAEHGRKIADVPDGLDDLGPSDGKPAEWLTNEDCDVYAAVGVWHRSPENVYHCAGAVDDILDDGIEDAITAVLAARWEIRWATDEVPDDAEYSIMWTNASGEFMDREGEPFTPKHRFPITVVSLLTHADLGPDPDVEGTIPGIDFEGPVEELVYRMARGAAIGGTAGIPFWQRESIADLVIGTLALNPEVLIRWASKVHDLRESPGGYGPPDPPERQHPYEPEPMPPVVKHGPTVHVTQEQLDHAAAIRGEIDAMAAQPAPVPNDGRDMWIAVLEDMMTRRDHGLEEYGTPLQPFNGRDQLADAYAEVLDLAVYLRTAIEERRHPVLSPTVANVIRKYFEANPPTNAADVLAVSMLNDYVRACAR